MRLSAIGLIVTLTLAILVAPLAAEAQPPTKVHRIGLLSAWLLPTTQTILEAFLEGLRDARLCRRPEPRHGVPRGGGQYERLPDLAAELVRLKVDVIVAQVTPAALAAKHATTTIPIVMAAWAIRWGAASSPAWRGPVATSPG